MEYLLCSHTHTHTKRMKKISEMIWNDIQDVLLKINVQKSTFAVTLLCKKKLNIRKYTRTSSFIQKGNQDKTRN